MKFQCPNCQFTIFNRRVKQCEHCGEELPPELLLPESYLKKAEKPEFNGDQLTSGGTGLQSDPVDTVNTVGTIIDVVDAAMDIASFTIDVFSSD